MSIGKLIVAVALSLGATLTVSPALACTAGEHAPQIAGEVTGLKTYTARYKTSTRGLSFTLNRALARAEDGSYRMTNGGSALIAGFEEESIFRVVGDAVVPTSYVYRGTGLMNRRKEVQFTEGSKMLRSLYKKQWYDLPYSDGLLDTMSQQEQMRLSLLNASKPEQDVMVTVVDGKRIKNHTLKFVGTEMLKTPLGEIETLHFERVHGKADRKSDTWVAPAWDYLMVRTTHIEDGKLVEGIITAATLDGVELGTAQ